MPKFIARRSTDYWMEIEADTVEEADEIACNADNDEWEYSESEIEIEDKDGNPA